MPSFAADWTVGKRIRSGASGLDMMRTAFCARFWKLSERILKLTCGCCAVNSSRSASNWSVKPDSRYRSSSTGSAESSVGTPEEGSSPAGAEELEDEEVDGELLPGGEHAARVRASAAPPAMSTAELRRFLMRTASPSKGYTLLSTHRRSQMAGGCTATSEQISRSDPPHGGNLPPPSHEVGSSPQNRQLAVPIRRRT